MGWPSKFEKLKQLLFAGQGVGMGAAGAAPCLPIAMLIFSVHWVLAPHLLRFTAVVRSIFAAPWKWKPTGLPSAGQKGHMQNTRAIM